MAQEKNQREITVFNKDQRNAFFNDWSERKKVDKSENKILKG